MPIKASVLVQLQLPFDGVRDRIRAAAECGQVWIGVRAQQEFDDHDISDVLVERALAKCDLLSPLKPGSVEGEWRCWTTFSRKGFRRGGVVGIAFSNGRIFVEDFYWDDDNG